LLSVVGAVQYGRSGFHIAVQQDFSVLAHDEDIHGSGMQIDPTVKLVLVGVESHEVSSLLVNHIRFPLPAYHRGTLRGEASIIINRLQATADSVRSCLAPASSRA
jgi:hypothetical protein